MGTTAVAERTVATESGVRFRLPDAGHRLRHVRLADNLGTPEARRQLIYRNGMWRLRLPRPPVDRMEYLFDVEDHNGARETILDPGNPAQAPGAFGPKSVVEFPGYHEPDWLAAPTVAADVWPFTHGGIDGELWSPDPLRADAAAPLLVVHDGPEFARLGGFNQYTGALIAAGVLPPLRVALLAPGDRNRRYGADPAYTRALTGRLVPALRAARPVTACVGVGVSLGGLAMLYAHRGRPGTFDGLFLQSGSFFQPDLDPQERGFSRFAAVTRFVDRVLRAHTDRAPVPATMTCGTVEENLANNRQMAEALRGLGYPVALHEVRDAHNYVAWRDALHPYLTELVRGVVDDAA